jgi:dihydroorotase-like cyclic amidohydrolase
MHVHLREPGQEHKETVATGALSAVTGGFTAVACMPNTNPVNDNAGVTELILRRAAEAQLARVYPIGAVSRGQKGEQLAAPNCVRPGASRSPTMGIRCRQRCSRVVLSSTPACSTCR